MTESRSRPGRKLTILAIGLTLLAISMLYAQADRDARHRDPYSTAFNDAVSVAIFGNNKSRYQDSNQEFLAFLKGAQRKDAPMQCNEIEIMTQSDWQLKNKHKHFDFPKLSSMTRGIPRHWIFEFTPIVSTEFSVAIIGDFDIHRIIDEKTLRFSKSILKQMINDRDRGYEWGINSRIAPLDFKILSRRKCDGFVIYDLLAR